MKYDTPAPFYALPVTSFYSQTSKLRKIEPISICILRGIHDQLWMSDYRYLTAADLQERMDLEPGILESTIRQLVFAKLLVKDREGYISSPDVDACYKRIIDASEKGTNTVNKRYDKTPK